jgi:hypothetical protein
MLSLPSDIYRYLFKHAKFRLRDFIKLTAVSKKLRMISLKEQYWHTISDTDKILYDFTRHVLHSASDIPYPFNQIQKMRSADSDKILHIPITNQNNLIQFYERFPHYQVFHMDNILEGFIPYHQKLPKNIHILFLKFTAIESKYLSLDYYVNRCMITEIIMPSNYMDCKIFMERYSQIEKLTIMAFENIEYLRQTRLKYLCVVGYEIIDHIIQNLPDTIESLIITYGHHSLSVFNKYHRLNYLKIRCDYEELNTTLDVNTIHLLISYHHSDIIINIPNAQHIIIENTYASLRYSTKNLYLTSLNAVTCQIIAIIVGKSSLLLPKCSSIIMSNNVPDLDYNSNIFKWE